MPQPVAQRQARERNSSATRSQVAVALCPGLALERQDTFSKCVGDLVLPVGYPRAPLCGHYLLNLSRRGSHEACSICIRRGSHSFV